MTRLLHIPDDEIKNLQSNYTINVSNNIVLFDNLNDANIAEFITTDCHIAMTTSGGFEVDSHVLSVDYSSNTITLSNSSPWALWAVIAYA